MNRDNSYKALESLLNTKPDFYSFLNSEEFKCISFKDPDLAHIILRGKTFTINGDIRSIHILSFGEMRASVTISNEFSGISNSTEVAIIIPEHLKSAFLKIKPDTGIKVTAKYIKLNVAVDLFELECIEEFNKELNFPYCVCAGDNPDPEACASDCHYILGYTKNTYMERCSLCGSKVKYIYDVYGSGLAELCSNKN